MGRQNVGQLLELILLSSECGETDRQTDRQRRSITSVTEVIICQSRNRSFYAQAATVM